MRIVALTVAAVLGVAPAALARVEVSSVPSTFNNPVANPGLIVRAATGDFLSNIRIGTEPATPDRWEVITATAPQFPTFPFNPGRNCEGIGPSGDGLPATFSHVRCDRVDGTTQVFLTNGPNTMTVFGAGAGDGQPFSVESRGGADEINAANANGPWRVNLGSNPDVYLGSEGPDTVFGEGGGDDVQTGFGNDVIATGAGADTVAPGPGEDSVSLGNLNDRVLAGGEDERTELDAYDGGPGFDTISYAQRQTAVFVARIASTGGTLGRSEDRIARFEQVFGGGGNDSLLGLSGHGGGGDDVLTGGSAANVITGGIGADVMRGFGGNDTIRARDGVRDTRIECGSGAADLAILDLRDPDPVDPGRCERIERRAVNEAAVVRIEAARVTGAALAVRLVCPRANDRACAGRLAAGGRGRRYSIRRGATETVVLPAGARARRGRPVTLESVEQGRFGPKTVIRILRPRG